MLSIENPPPDPPCSYQFQQLSRSSSDERASQKQKQQQQQQVDLPKPPLLDDQRTPLANFSIREYVFTTRSKDINKNWPFSRKNLQLCLKHGVKEVLPPFQPLNTVRNKSFERCSVETGSSDKQNINRNSNSDKALASPDNRLALDSSLNAELNTKFAESCVDVSSCRSGEENDFPSTTTSLSQSEIESFHYSRPPSTRLETETLLNTSVEVEPAGPSVIHKADTTARLVGKKCKLIVKFGGQSDRSSPEDIASNCSVLSETMSSKICPVCKTFSSSSNTTLNAHIDQCLSVESTPKWTASAKITRHRIKPRKTRLMVDIYATAKHCTLEELDRRNGTSWATISRLSAQEPRHIESSNEGKKQKISPVQLEDAGDVGPVYIDSSGTKVRILSKFNDSPPLVSKLGEDTAARKSLKGGKLSKYISKKKKHHLAQKHQKHLKHATKSRTFFSVKHGSQICGSNAERYDGAGSSEKEIQKPKQNKTADSGTLRPWVCSKRRGFTKKITGQEDHLAMKCKWRVPHLSENDQSFLVDSLAENDDGKDSGNDPQDSGAQVSVRKNWPSKRTRVGSLLLGSRTVGNVERSVPPMEQNVMKLTEDRNCIHDNYMLKSPSHSRNHASFLRKKRVDARKCFSINSNAKSSRSSRAIVSKAMRFSSFRKNVSSVSSQSSPAECRPNNLKNWSSFWKSQVHSPGERDDEVAVPYCEVNQQYIMNDYSGSEYEREEITDEVSLSRSTILESGKETRMSQASQGDEALGLNRLKSGSNCYDHQERIDMESLVGAVNDFDCVDSAGEQVKVHDENITGLYPKDFDRKNSVSLNASIDAEFYELNHSSRAQSNSFQSIDDYGGLLCQADAPGGPTEPDSDNGQEMFSVHEAGNDVLQQTDHMEIEMESEVGQRTIFSEVEPIPIPGPPGSFLPSPRDMGSEDFQGNSSLTSSRIQSSPDQHELVDGESSDSPISAASTVSDSTAGRSDFKNSEQSALVGPSGMGQKIRSDFGITNVEPSIEKADTVSSGAEKGTVDGGYFKLDRISMKKGSLSLKNDQPCCCQRKERFPQGVALNQEESQLLRRRKLAPMMVPAVGKPVGCSSNPRPTNFLDVTHEVVPPSSSLAFGSAQKVPPVSEPPGYSTPLKDSPSTSVRFQVRADGDSASPSGSNPILRLMGKDLMVVNKDENASGAIDQVQSGRLNEHEISELPTFSTVSPAYNQSQECHSFHHMVPQGAVVFGVDPCKQVCQCFDVELSNSFGRNSDAILSKRPAEPSPGMFQSECTGRGSSASARDQEYKGDYRFYSRQNMLKSRLNMSSRYDTEKITTPDHLYKRADSSAHPIKEIIIIDDAPEHDTGLIGDAPNYPEIWRQSQVVSYGISNPAGPVYKPSCIRPFSCCQSQDPPPSGESPVVFTAGFPATSSRLANSSQARWGCIPEGAVVVPRNPFTAAPSSSGHLRSTALYYSHGFS